MLNLGIIIIKTLSPSTLRNSYLKFVCVLVCVFLASCSSFKTKENAQELRLGYLLNVSHAVAMIGIESRAFTNVETQYFSSGGYLLNALITKNLDIAYIGPGPYLNALSKGVKLKLLKLSSSGANSLILSDKYEAGKNFKIKKLGIPQIGNTQDLLAKYLVAQTKEHKARYKELSPEMKEMLDLPTIKFSKRLQYIAVNPAELETVFFTGDIDAALVAEPWGTILEDKGYTNLSKLSVNSKNNLVNELEGNENDFIYHQLHLLNQFPAALLVVDEDFYNKNTKIVDNFVKEQDAVLDYLKNNQDESITLIQQHLRQATKKNIPYSFLSASLNKLSFDTNLDQSKLDLLTQVAQDHNYIRKGKSKNAN